MGSEHFVVSVHSNVVVILRQKKCHSGNPNYRRVIPSASRRRQVDHRQVAVGKSTIGESLIAGKGSIHRPFYVFPVASSLPLTVPISFFFFRLRSALPFLNGDDTVTGREHGKVALVRLLPPPSVSPHYLLRLRMLAVGGPPAAFHFVFIFTFGTEMSLYTGTQLANVQMASDRVPTHLDRFVSSRAVE
ncbi:hypothetical protein GPALN_009768 [Globodera pallida]|nr:hypothetical protein GPALN_009768 [Globodera pallida]